MPEISERPIDQQETATQEAQTAPDFSKAAPNEIDDLFRGYLNNPEYLDSDFVKEKYQLMSENSSLDVARWLVGMAQRRQEKAHGSLYANGQAILTEYMDRGILPKQPQPQLKLQEKPNELHRKILGQN